MCGTVIGVSAAGAAACPSRCGIAVHLCCGLAVCKPLLPPGQAGPAGAAPAVKGLQRLQSGALLAKARQAAAAIWHRLGTSMLLADALALEEAPQVGQVSLAAWNLQGERGRVGYGTAAGAADAERAFAPPLRGASAAQSRPHSRGLAVPGSSSRRACAC